MKSEGMKPEKTNLVEIGYNKEENKYFATFEVQDLDKSEIGLIMTYCEISKLPRDRKLYIKDDIVYVTDFFEADLFESMYPYMIESAKQNNIPERVEPEILDKEIDICLMEQDVEFAVRNAANPERYRDLIKGVVDD